MKIPTHIIITNGELPQSPGVYYMKDAKGDVLYVGKAINLARRVAQYWERPHGAHIEAMVPSIVSVDFRTTPSAIEALILEANEIQRLDPPVNVIGKDNASFLHLVITNEPYPRPLLIRGYELKATPRKKFKYVFGPYTSSASLRAVLEYTRKLFHWSDCVPGQKRPCFYYHIKLCPGVCVGKISRRDYSRIIRRLVMFFEGKTGALLRQTEREMKKAAKEERFEEAARLRNLMFSLTHINDIAVIKRDYDETPQKEEIINVFGRVEAYDISNTSGLEAVGSNVVFFEGLPKKTLYKKFKIKTVKGPDDTAMRKEMLRRRFAHARVGEEGEWKLPDLIVIDGGKGQVNVAMEVLREKGLKIPLVGLAKGFDRKQDVIVYGERTPELERIAKRYKQILQHARDEAHRFAVSYHRYRRGKGFLKK